MTRKVLCKSIEGMLRTDDNRAGNLNTKLQLDLVFQLVHMLPCLKLTTDICVTFVGSCYTLVDPQKNKPDAFLQTLELLDEAWF